MNLTKAETIVLDALTKSANRWGESLLTMEELKQATGYGRTSLSLAVSGLSEHGVIKIIRTKRNLGKLYKNKYLLVDRTSTASNNDSNYITTTTVTTKVINTSYLLWADAQEKEEEMVNRWSEDDDHVGGFGLLEGEVPSGLRSKPLSKRDPKTRHQRPHEEWTPADMASEFASRCYSRVRGIPGMVDTYALRGALAANRQKFGVSATVEYEILEKFFGDYRNISAIKNSPKAAHRMFLVAITNSVNTVVHDLALAEPDDDDYEEISHTEYVYASDGKKFDNSVPGRLRLERYEAQLRSGK